MFKVKLSRSYNDYLSSISENSLMGTINECERLSSTITFTLKGIANFEGMFLSIFNEQNKLEYSVGPDDRFCFVVEGFIKKDNSLTVFGSNFSFPYSDIISEMSLLARKELSQRKQRKLF